MYSQVLRLPDVIKKTGMARSTIYLKIARGEFPKPFKLGKRSVAWPDAVIDKWIDDRINEVDQ